MTENSNLTAFDTDCRNLSPVKRQHRKFVSSFYNAKKELSNLLNFCIKSIYLYLTSRLLNIDMKDLYNSSK